MRTISTYRDTRSPFDCYLEQSRRRIGRIESRHHCTTALAQPMAYPLQERYVNLLTDFGFKRVFGSEPNKQLLIDFLNTLLPERHKIASLSYKSTENLGNTQIDRKAIFDIYCQGENGERFIVEIQKAKQNFFKDRSVFYASFPIQEQALRGEWNFQLASVYSVGVLDFIFDDHQEEDTLIHTVELKNQHCKVFQGRKAEKVEIARSLLYKLPVETISQTTGLTADEIARIQKDTNLQ